MALRDAEEFRANIETRVASWRQLPPSRAGSTAAIGEGGRPAYPSKSRPTHGSEIGQRLPKRAAIVTATPVRDKATAPQVRIQPLCGIDTPAKNESGVPKEQSVRPLAAPT